MGSNIASREVCELVQIYWQPSLLPCRLLPMTQRLSFARVLMLFDLSLYLRDSLLCSLLTYMVSYMIQSSLMVHVIHYLLEMCNNLLNKMELAHIVMHVRSQ